MTPGDKKGSGNWVRKKFWCKSILLEGEGGNSTPAGRKISEDRKKTPMGGKDSPFREKKTVRTGKKSNFEHHRGLPPAQKDEKSQKQQKGGGPLSMARN